MNFDISFPVIDAEIIHSIDALCDGLQIAMIIDIPWIFLKIICHMNLANLLDQYWPDSLAVGHSQDKLGFQSSILVNIIF